MEEIGRLRERLGAREAGDVRAHGAVTIEDLAEAFDVSSADVRKHLDLLRAERAFSPAVARKAPSQKVLLAMAVVLFGTAFAINRINQSLRPPTEEEIEQRLQEAQEARLRRPKKVVYPITTTTREAPVAPPWGFTITIDGRYTRTVGQESSVGPLTVAEAKAALKTSMTALLEMADKAEATAPIPEKPLPKPQYATFGSYQEGYLAFHINGLTGYLPAPATDLSKSATVQSERTSKINEAVDQAVDSQWQSQQQSLGWSRGAEVTSIFPPPGFSLTLRGRRSTSIMGNNLILRPLDVKGAEERLEQCLRAALKQDSEFPRYLAPDLRAGDAKIPVPAFTTASITGPFGPFELKIPTAPSKAFPTGRDVMKGMDNAIKDAVSRAARQIRDINSSVRPTSK